MIELIDAPGVSPNGHYSVAAAALGLVFTSILLPGEESDSPSAMTVEQQLAALLGRLERTLEASGSGLGNIVRATIYLTDVANRGAANRAYSAALGAHRPARGIVVVKDLHHGWSVAMDAVAAASGATR